MNKYDGVFVAIITPFKDGVVDYEAVKKITKRCLDNGAHGIVPCGTTGEAPNLTNEERFKIIQTVAEICSDKAVVLAGAGSNSTSSAIKFAEIAKDAGATAHLQVVPYYNKPPQDGLFKHFMPIADSIDLPMMLYNVPGRTIVKLEPETIAKLAAHERIVGIKEAGGDVGVVKILRKLCPHDFKILSGDDGLNLEIYKAGGNGTVSVAANVWPKMTVRIWNAAAVGKMDEAESAHLEMMPLIEELFCKTNPIPVKAAMHILGFCENELRLPLVSLEGSDMKRMKGLLKQFGLL